MTDLMVKGSDNGIFSLQKIRTSQIPAGNRVVRDEGAVASQVLDYAVDLEIIEENLFRKVRVDSRRVFRRVPKKASATQVFSE